MKKAHQNLAIVIPSLDPTRSLITYVDALIAQGFCHIIIVNDGSAHTYDAIFEKLASQPACTVLTHATNQGKGAALKTAYAYIVAHLAACVGVVTADSDGQHAVQDVCQVADALLSGENGLFLGSRNFAQMGIPLKSRVGNRLSSALFCLLHGKWVHDTQTGLRGFATNLLPFMLDIAGGRFEYEMAVLTACVHRKIPVHTISIQTIYWEGNASTHFRPIADSLQVGAVLLRRLGRFMLSSGVSCLTDVSICWTLLALLQGMVASDLLRIGLAVTLARMVSMLVNYRLNKVFVFHATAQKYAFVRYVALAIANMVAAVWFIYLGQTVLGIHEYTAKILADTILFIINYQIQRLWVFPTITAGGVK